jgi:hypothetical protein
VRAVPRRCELNPGICLTTEKKARKHLRPVSRRVPVGTMYLPNLVAKLSVSRLVFERYPVWIPPGSADVLFEDCSFFCSRRTCCASTQFKLHPVGGCSVPNIGAGFQGGGCSLNMGASPCTEGGRTRGSAVGWSTALQGGRSRVRFPMLSLEFSSVVYSGCNRNEYQEHLRDKGGRYAGLITLPPSCAVCIEILGASTPGAPRGCPGL